MKEAAFIKINKSRWQRYEQKLNDISTLTPDSIAEIYINLTDDVSFASSHYPNSELYGYLNGLAVKFHHSIYQNKKEKKNRFITFWMTELPLVIANSHKQLLFSFIIFTVSVIIGALSQANDENFARLILSDAYVNMTLENIENGNPMGVYEETNPILMVLYIFFNNAIIAIKMFVYAIFTSIATCFFIVYNGIMLGCFQYFFYQEGVFLTSFLTIWIHGTLEISAIIIAGAAGLVLGNGLLFPGTYSRMASLRKAAIKGLKIGIGIIPVLLMAAIIESFVTRLFDMPVILKVLIITLSALFIFLYFVLYPIKLKRNATRSEN